MIDAATGRIRFDDGFELSALTRETDVTCALGNNWKDRDQNRWRWMPFPECHRWSGSDYSVSAFFKNDKLRSVEIMATDPRFGQSWEDHSEAKELERKAVHDQVLNEAIGKHNRVFEWGSVWSEYDPKGGISSFGIHYGGSEPINPGAG